MNDITPEHIRHIESESHCARHVGLGFYMSSTLQESRFFQHTVIHLKAARSNRIQTLSATMRRRHASPTVYVSDPASALSSAQLFLSV